MTGFDVTALLVVGLAAGMGFLRGFVQEILSLCAWGAALVAINLFHTAVAAWLVPHLHTESGAAVAAFAICALVPYFAVKLAAGWLGSATRASLLGPVDRVLGFGFGAVKGTVAVVMAFSLLVLGYDTVWGAGGRPTWLTHSRTYPFVNASSEALVRMIGRRHQEAAAAADGSAPDDATSSEAAPEDTPTPSPAPTHSAHRHHPRAGAE